MSLTFAQQIRATRQMLQLTQVELAELLGHTAQTISNYECGRARPWARDEARILLKLLELSNGRRPRLLRVNERI
jgi:transcriptional regulator with XRE-family HTH domain